MYILLPTHEKGKYEENPKIYLKISTQLLIQANQVKNTDVKLFVGYAQRYIKEM